MKLHAPSGSSNQPLSLDTENSNLTEMQTGPLDGVFPLCFDSKWNINSFNYCKY